MSILNLHYHMSILNSHYHMPILNSHNHPCILITHNHKCTLIKSNHQSTLITHTANHVCSSEATNYTHSPHKLTNTHKCSSEETTHVQSPEIAATFNSAIWPIKSILLGHFSNLFGQNCCIKCNSIKLPKSLISYTRSCNENNIQGLPVKMMDGDILLHRTLHPRILTSFFSFCFLPK